MRGSVADMTKIGTYSRRTYSFQANEKTSRKLIQNSSCVTFDRSALLLREKHFVIDYPNWPQYINYFCTDTSTEETIQSLRQINLI